MSNQVDSKELARKAIELRTLAILLTCEMLGGQKVTDPDTTAKEAALLAEFDNLADWGKS